MMPNVKHVPQVTLETIIKKNKEEAEELFAKAKSLILENRRIEVEMIKILSTSTPGSGVASVRPSAPPASVRVDSEVVYAANNLIRSWRRRHKRNFKTAEQDLMDACERLALVNKLNG